MIYRPTFDVLATVTDNGEVYISNNSMAVFTLNPVIAVITYPTKISDTTPATTDNRITNHL